MNTRELAGIREIELQRDFALSRAAEYAGELAECKEQLAAAVKTIETLHPVIPTPDLTSTGPLDGN